MRRRLTGLAIAAALQAVALVLAHELVFLARYGSRYGEELVHSGHGEAWTAAVLTSLGLGVGVAALGLARLARLCLIVRRLGRAGDHQRPRGSDTQQGAELAPSLLFRALLRLAPRMALLGVALLTSQENLERAAAGLAVPGPRLLLSPEYPAGLVITVAVALAVSFVAALFEWQHRTLLARLRAARARLPRLTRTRALRPGVLGPRPVESLLGRRSALRAPPSVAIAR